MNGLSIDKMTALKNALAKMKDEGASVPDMLGWIYDLGQESILSEEQEEELYCFVDPYDEYNEAPHDYWWEWIGENPLAKYVK